MNGLNGSAKDESLRWSLSFETTSPIHICCCGHKRQPYLRVWLILTSMTPQQAHARQAKGMNGLSGSAEDESLRWSLSFEANDVTHPYSLLWHSTEANENVGFKNIGLWDFKLYLLYKWICRRWKPPWSLSFETNNVTLFAIVAQHRSERECVL